jgi:hypothetical protein
MSRQGTQHAFRRRIAVTLVSCLGLLALPAIAVADEAEPLFEPSDVAEIDFALPPASLQKLEEEPETDEYQHAEISVDVAGQTVSLGDVGFRLKGGHGSFRDLTGKAAFKVKFNQFVKGQKLLGLKKLTLNNMVQDPSMVHETITYELFRAMGLPAPRTGYAFVRINGDPYGIHLNLETYDDIMLPRFFPSTQHLYEADAVGVDVRTGEANTYEVDEGDDEDISDLEALIEAVNDEAGDWSENVSPFADLGQMTRAWAVERYVGHWDGYAGLPNSIDPDTRPNNYYLHSDEAGIFQIMPWGTDQTWERDDIEFDEPAGGLMFNKCLADASCKQLYLEGLADVHCVVPGLDQGPHAAQLAAMLAPYQAEEDEGKRETSEDEIAAGVAFVEGMAALRPEQLEEYLTEEGVPDPCPPPQPPDQTSGGNPAPPPPAAKIVSVSRRGKRLQVKAISPSNGVLRLSAKTAGRRGSLVCSRRKAVATGAVKVSCRLSRAALDALAEGPLRLNVRVRFPAIDGKHPLRSRQVRLPRL